jgi:hypothetical protein
MPHSLSFEPPEPRPGSLTRPRLLRALLGRWERRVVTVIGGPGLGKTTLLAQSVAENRLAARGQDVWIGAEPADADGDGFAHDVRAALEPGDGEVPADPPPTAREVADGVWRRAPVEVCLIIDNVHVIPPGSAGSIWLADLIEALPVNGHVLMSSRARLPVPLARLAASGALDRLDEDDLRFTDDELADFATRRGVGSERLAISGGWPAMAELAAAVDRDPGGEYLWEEVLTPLGAGRRRALAVVCAPVTDPNFALTVEGLRLMIRWMLGHVDEAVAGLEDLTERARAVGMTQNLAVLLSVNSRIHSQLGDIETSRALCEEAATVLGPEAGDPVVRLAVARAALELAGGDEPGATATLEAALRARSVDGGVDRRLWRHTLPLTYVLVQESRAHWDAAPLHGFFSVSRDLAAAVVSARPGRTTGGSGRWSCRRWASCGPPCITAWPPTWPWDSSRSTTRARPRCWRRSARSAGRWCVSWRPPVPHAAADPPRPCWRPCPHRRRR